MAWSRNEMAQRAAQELEDGFYVNLGIGLPTLVANYIPKNMNVWLQSENGLLGIGAFPTEETLDADLINFKSERIPKTKIKRKNKIKLKLFSSKKNRKEKKTKIPPVRGTLFFDAYFWWLSPVSLKSIYLSSKNLFKKNKQKKSNIE